MKVERVINYLLAGCVLFSFWTWLFGLLPDLPDTSGLNYPQGHAPTQIWDETRASVCAEG